MQPGQAAPLPVSGGYGALALTTLVVLVAVCVVVLLVARYAGRWLGTRGDDGGVVRVRARVPLEPRRSLYVIEVGGRTLLLGSSEGGVTMLTELAPEELPPAGMPRRGFAELVAKALARRAAPADPDPGPS